MKILYLSNDRRAAEQAALSLRAAVPSIRVAWAASFGEALRWLDGNRDVLALIVEVDSDIPGCELFVRQVRASVIVPVIVVAVNDPARAVMTFKSVADAIIAKAPSFFSDLPHVVSRVLGKAQPAPRAARGPLQFLYVGDAALARECLASPGTIEVIEAVPEPNRKFDGLPTDLRSGAPLAFDVLFIEHGYPGVDTHAILKDIASRDLQIPVVIVAEWDAGFAALSFKLGAIDYVFKSRASFQAVVFRMGRLLAHAAHLRARAGVDEVAAARDQFAQREAEYTRSIGKAAQELQALDEKVATTEAALRQAEQLLEEESRAADARLTEASTARQNLEQRVAEADIALRYAEQRAAEQCAARQQATERHAQVESELARQTAHVDAVEQKLAGAKLALQRAEQRHASEMSELAARFAESDAKADADRRAVVEEATRRQATFAAELTQEAVRREALAKQLADARSAHREAEHERASEITALEAKLCDAVAALGRTEERAAVDRQTAAGEAVQRQAEFEGRLAAEVAKGQVLAKQLADAEMAGQRAEQQHASEMRDAVARLADTDAALRRVEQQAAEERHGAVEEAARRQAQFAAELTQEVAQREALAKQVADAQSAHRQAQQEHASEIASAAARFADHQQRAETQLAEAIAAADALQVKLSDAVAGLRRVEQQAAEERHAAVEEAARRQAEFDAALAQQLADAQSAHRLAEQEHASEIASAAARLADHQQRAETQLAEVIAAADALEAKLRDAVVALGRAEARAAVDRQTAAGEGVQRQAEFEGRLAAEVAKGQELAKHLAEAEAARQQTERTLAETAATLARVEQQAADARQAAVEEAARRQAEFDATLAQQVANQHAVQKALVDGESEHRRVTQQLASEIEAAATRLAEYRKDTEARLARAGAEAAEALRNAEQRAVAERQIAARQAADRQADVEAELGQAIARREAVESELADVRASADQAQVDLARQRVEYSVLQQSLDQTTATAEETLENVSKDRAAERVRFEALVAERESQLRDQAARQRASVEATAQSIAQLREQLKARDGQLESTRREREVLKADAHRVPRLRKEIDDIRAENRRHFDHAPVNMCRCTKDGTISLANHAFANFLGYETPEELQNVDFAASVFESADEMQWIVERCLASHATESVETTWTRKDGSRIIVRVLAVATAPDSIDLTAEDITTLRVLEEKLRISQRMEGVARYASEVAVTCDNLLGHVEQEALRWLARIDSDAARYHGELLLEEVTRAAKYLRQLAVYGKEEKKVPELVDMTKVLRDLEPVLKRVAGSEIDLVLPKAATPLNLDVEAERVERMLVNVAAYGRERMPLGGRLMFEVAPVVVDRKFVATYPNVRPGAHVLLTIHEVRGAARPGFSAAVRNQASGANAIASASKSPGVDLGALQALVSDCGGHLWMMVEPPGDMVLKIHLPRRVLDRPDPRTPAKASVRARWINRPAGVGH